MKNTAALAAATAALGAGALYAYIKKDPSEKKKLLYDTADSAIHTAIRTIARAVPDKDAIFKEEYIPENFFEGTADFITAPKKGAKWHLGYAREVLTPDDWDKKDYYVAGFLKVPPNVVSGVIDDICVRTVCVNDSSGRGTAAFCVIDCIGIANTDVRRIRARLMKFAKENNIVSINVSATHCHSGVDTQGLWGNLLPDALKTNFKKKLKNENEGFISGRDAAFMENLYIKTAKSVRDAFAGMKAGKLYATVTDEKEYSHDKRPPFVVEKDMTVLRFVPDDKSSRETVAVMMAAHPTGVGYSNTKISGDYPYYIVDELNRNNCDGIFFQGPQLAVAVSRDPMIDDELLSTDEEGYQKYGRGVARFALSLRGGDREKEVTPILNISHREVFVKAENELFLLIGFLGLVSNKIIRSGRGKLDCSFVTEIGYAHIGSDLRLALIPGELAPEIAFGGAFSAEESYCGSEWAVPALQSVVKDGAKLTVIGLCNDAIGYMMPANDYGSVIAPLHYEEAISAGPHAGETIARAFIKLVKETVA